MLTLLARAARPILALPTVRRTRRNHGLEHATITILSTRIRNLRMAGRSDSGGFYLLGDVPTDSVEQAVHDALRRMRSGEHRLAVHPNCGTNLVTGAFMTGIAAMVGLTGAERSNRIGRLPLVMALVMIAGLFSQPLGLSLQKHFTTDGDPADLVVRKVTRSEMRGPFGKTPLVVHRVTTQSS